MVAYIYFLRQHMDSRVIDLYHRLADSEDKFTLPYDNEVSMSEVKRLVEAAERWRGQHGERRKVVVFDYNWLQDEGEEKQRSPSNGIAIDRVVETTSLVAIHTIYLNGPLNCLPAPASQLTHQSPSTRSP